LVKKLCAIELDFLTGRRTSSLQVKYYFQVVTITPDSCFGLIFGDFLVEVGAGTAYVTTGVSVCIGSAAALGKDI
jgi:hypothetical protein